MCNNEIYIYELFDLPHANIILKMATSECRKLACVIIYEVGAHSRVR